MSQDNAFVDEYRPLVHSVVNKVRAEYELTHDPQDLLASGFQGLVEARQRFDPDRGIQFNTFAYYRIRGAVLDHVRKMGFASRRSWQRIRAARAADTICEASGSRHAQHRGDPEAAAATIAETLGQLAVAFVVASSSEEMASGESSPEENVVDVQEADRLRASVEALPERERRLIRGFYFEGQRFDELAKAMGISKSWASRLHLKALGDLRKALSRGR